MPNGSVKTGQRSITLGFIAVHVGSDSGLRGGYLLTSEFGRPIEFHYTSELRIPRQQQILYGTEFEPYVYSELLAKPLTDRQKTVPQIIVVNRHALLDLRRLIPAPVACLVAQERGKDEDGEQDSCGLQVQTHSEFAQDQIFFEKIRALVPASFDWLEPFERLEQALSEVRDPQVGLVA